MMDKFLPIKFFEKRRIDELRTEPPGGQGNPSWILKGEALEKHSEQLSSNVAELSSAFDARGEEDVLPMVMVTTINDDAIAKSHRSEVVSLLTSDHQSDVIGVESVMPSHILPDNLDGKDSSEVEPELHETRMLLSLVTTKELLENIDRKLQDTQNHAKLISTINEMRPFEARAGKYNPENTAYCVGLLDYQNTSKNELAQKLFRNKCKAHGIVIEHETRYSSDMRLFRVRLDSMEDLELMRKFEGVRYIEETVPIRAVADSFDQIDALTIKQPKPDESYPVIGVLDSGIRKNAYLSPWILEEKEEYYEEELQNKSHGSMVSSILEYSDELNGTDFTAADGIYLFEAVVIPDLKKEEVYAGDVIDNCRDAIHRHREKKVWVMAVGTDEECALDSFSEYGMALDNIAEENNVLIIKSAGNNRAFDKDKPMPRIAKMADSVHALVVGSIAEEQGPYDYAGINEVSPFSRCGPGPQYLIKPDLVAYGGNGGRRPDGTLSLTGVKVLDEYGSQTHAAGTSFSTPWVARIAADLSYQLDGEFDPLLVKTLLVHHAQYPIGQKISMTKKKKYMGFGMPLGTKDILYNDDYEITLILRDSLERKSYIDIMEFPFPQSLIGEDGLFRGQITLTMVNSPILRTSQGPEYCQSDIAVAFGTMDGIEVRDTSKPRVFNPRGPIKPENLMKESLFSSGIFNILDEGFLPPEPFARERTLLRLGDKWRPIKKYAVNLSELTEGNRRKFLAGHRQWFMQIKGLFRDAIQREADITGEILKQEFCVILTIRDPERRAPVYNEVTQQLQEKGFIYTNVPLRNEIREHVRIEEENRG